ncbi:MAG: protein-(glutamine-N5) methyltransferase, release factor-specific [Omnitrophica bacterium GWA2_52_12]|nr:MAG: protein-(glutamine-N5) methyltransferase, release factor-specific [Omnitrophica bacterium GWA2_52_12]
MPISVSFGPKQSWDSWKALLAWGQAELTALGPRESRTHAEYLLEEASGLARWQFERSEALPDAQICRRYEDWIGARKKRVPLVYITGRAYFRHEVLEAGPGCLIPRPETEQLVEYFLTRSGFKKEDAFSFLDMGTGTGAIAISLLRIFTKADAVLADVSEEALAYARRNVEKYGLSTRAKLIQTDLFANLLPMRWQAILSNPPYVAEAELAGLEPELSFEPKQALAGGWDGLDYYRRLAAESPRFLVPGGWLVLEAGFGQTEAIRDLLRAAGFEDIRIFKDDAGLERVVMARLGIKVHG